ncbi:hypothetical protein [Streptosporangium carneum]|uniref:Anti-proliferative protein domain-containing protein n=1 Tax=Streptosporangium carneum TaxID=47481 RepID=A0A9W6I968_9ACTN|nr:hypothetical protein [Streptosporangium carneum]GLK14092.1 hypothetical protein GCM10017600_75040 [Streptosporangium carneum]
MSSGTVEARTAAHWWADQLTGPTTTEQVEAFRAALEAAILAGPVSHWSWRKAVESGDPHWGAILRVVAAGYDPEPILITALKAAGIEASDLLEPLPPETIMWINPGQVRVSSGHSDTVAELKLIAL